VFGVACYPLPVSGVRVHIGNVVGYSDFFFFLFSLYYSINPRQPFAKN